MYFISKYISIYLENLKSDIFIHNHIPAEVDYTKIHDLPEMENDH